MGKLEELRQLVTEMFESATDKDTIDKVAKINCSIDGVEKEQQELVDKNAELIKDYRSLVKHTSFSSDIPVDDIGGQRQTFDIDEAISAAFAKIK